MSDDDEDEDEDGYMIGLLVACLDYRIGTTGVSTSLLVLEFYVCGYSERFVHFMSVYILLGLSLRWNISDVQMRGKVVWIVPLARMMRQSVVV